MTYQDKLETFLIGILTKAELALGKTITVNYIKQIERDTPGIEPGELSEWWEDYR